jgi:hypothetical protein
MPRRKPRTKRPFRVDGGRKGEIADPAHRREAARVRGQAFKAFFDAIGERGLETVLAERGQDVPPQ